MLALFTPSAAWARKIAPVDAGAHNPSFRAFRQDLVAALRRGDQNRVLAIVDPRIEDSVFEPEWGVRGFRELWSLDDPDGKGWERLRVTLLEILARGGTFQRGEFTAPYVYSRWPDDVEWADDRFQYACAVGPAEVVRAEPSEAATAVGRLHHDIVRVPQKGYSPNVHWTNVVTPAGRSGWVHRRCLCFPMGYRASFRRVNGHWRLTTLIGGD
jgi:hypothetical protein